jgi:hypothetical protein
MQFLNLGLFFLVRLAGCSSASACKQTTCSTCIYKKTRWMEDGIGEVRSIRSRFQLFVFPSTSCSKCISAYTNTGFTAAEKQRNLKQEERQEAGDMDILPMQFLLSRNGVMPSHACTGIDRQKWDWIV